MGQPHPATGSLWKLRASLPVPYGFLPILEAFFVLLPRGQTARAWGGQMLANAGLKAYGRPVGLQRIVSGGHPKARTRGRRVTGNGPLSQERTSRQIGRKEPETFCQPSQRAERSIGTPQQLASQAIQRISPGPGRIPLPVKAFAEQDAVVGGSGKGAEGNLLPALPQIPRDQQLGGCSRVAVKDGIALFPGNLFQFGKQFPPNSQIPELRGNGNLGDVSAWRPPMPSLFK